MFQIQQWLGNFFGIAADVCLFAMIPVFVICIVLLARRTFKGLKKFFLYSALVYILVFGFEELLAGGAYHAAQQAGFFVPWTVKTLEDISGAGGALPIDEEWQYTVVQFNEQQMDRFIGQIASKGTWSQQTINPHTLVQNNDYELSASKYPFPNVETNGYVYSKTNRIQRERDYWTKKVVCFLDIKTRTLYVFYDYHQWGE